MKEQNKQSNKKFFFDQEEKELSESVEKGEWRSLPKKEKEEKTDVLVTSAKNTLSKNKTVSLRLSERDLMKLKARAAEEGIPYQTLISSLIHKYVKEDG